MEQARKESDELKVQSMLVKKELEQMKDQVRTLDLQLRARPPPSSAAAATATTMASVDAPSAPGAGQSRSPVSALEEAVQCAASQHAEAQQIRSTFEQIVRWLKSERMGFDTQIAALERTLAHKRHNLEELTLLAHEASRAHDGLRQELSKRLVACEEEQAQREATLRQKQQLIQQRLLQRKGAVADAASRPTTERVGADGDAGLEEDAQEDSEQATHEEAMEEEEQWPLAVRKRQLERLQQAHRRVKDTMGVGTVDGVRDKVAAQAETLQSLAKSSHENQARLERLQEARDALRTAVNRSRFAPQTAKSQKEVLGQLARDQERLGQLQSKHQQLAKLLKECVGGNGKEELHVH